MTPDELYELFGRYGHVRQIRMYYIIFLPFSYGNAQIILIISFIIIIDL